MNLTTLARLAALSAIVGCGGSGSNSPMDGAVDTGPECVEAADCDGTPSCGGGTWACTDGACVEVCPECQEGDAPVACYDGPAGTEDFGACHGGFRHCIGGVLGPCLDQVLPSGESCNAIDDDCDAETDEDLTRTCGVGACAATADCVAGVMATCLPSVPGAEVCDGSDGDCDGVVDEDCGAACVYVAPTGDDATGDGSTGLPYASISKGIDEAYSAGIGHVCVASGASCPSNFTYTESIVMLDGVSVHGAYESTTWTRTLANPLPGTCATNIINTDADGVNFDSSVTSPTALEGFTVRALDVDLATGVTAAVTVDGSSGAVLSSLHINAPSMDVVGATTYGVHVIGGATPLIAHSRIFGGEGSLMAVGVQSEESAPSIADNCDTVTFGPCVSSCSGFGMSGASELAIRGHAGAMGGDTYGVVLVDSPGASVTRSVVCSSAGGGFMATLDFGQTAGIRISGDANGTVVQQNSISSQGGDSGHGIQMEACGGAAPLIVANVRATGDATAADGASDGIRAMGDCHPIIDGNGAPSGQVLGDGQSTQINVEPSGIHCGSDGTTASRCVVTNNLNVAGHGFSSVSGVPAFAAAIRCDDGACARVEGNSVGTVNFGFGGAFGQQGGKTYGIWVGDTGTLVARNRVVGGCGATRSTGIHAENSRARIENNVVSAGMFESDCTPTGTAYVGLEVVPGDGLNEPDVHSNDLFGIGATGACSSAALSLSVATAAPDGPRGLFRNNILYSGTCDTTYGVWEEAEAADPRVFTNNDLGPDTSTALYRDENATDITDVSMVGGSDNLSVDPLFTDIAGLPPDLTLQVGSPCIDAGTTDGAPLVDFAGDTRPQGSAPDVGAFEATP